MPWRRQQTAHTREHIIAVAKHLLVAAPTDPFTHERVAQSAGLGARTVYRHFPSRTDLMQALWESIRDETRTRFPGTEEEVVEFARTQFKDFNEREALVRASNAFPGASELRARGSLREGRLSAAASQDYEGFAGVGAAPASCCVPGDLQRAVLVVAA